MNRGASLVPKQESNAFRCNMERQYLAFISYSHADNREEGRRWANWLHERLESYPVPERLVGMQRGDGEPIPKELFPIFRDEKEFAASHDLKEAIVGALNRSRFLVVVCSPRAAKSIYVDAEIRAFKEQEGGAARIVALIVDGDPFASVRSGADPERECLPPSLLRGVPGPGGAIDWTAAAEPLCADARVEGKDEQGFTSAADFRAGLRRSSPDLEARQIRKRTAAFAARLEDARLKVIAAILGVPLGTLVRETNQFRIQRLRRALAVVGSLALAAVLAATWAFWAQYRANRERLAAEHANSQANRLINEMLGDLGDKLRPLGKLDLLAEVSDAAKTYFMEMPEGKDDAEVTLQRAFMWMAHGEILEARNKEDLALQSFHNAQQTLESLGPQRLAVAPEARRLYAVSFERIADVMEDRSVQDALRTTQTSVTLLEQLIAENTHLPRSLLDRDLAQAHERMGDILEDGAADLRAAREHFETSRTLRRRLAAELGRNDPGFERDFGVACGRIGDVLKMEGRYAEAREAYQEGLDVRKDLLEQNGLNAIWINEVSRSYDSLGLVEEALGNTEEAIAAHEQALKIRIDLALYDPANHKILADLARSRQAMARVLANAGRMDEARNHLQKALTVQRDLATGTKPDIKVAIDWIATLRLSAEWRMQSRLNGSAGPFLAESREILDRIRQSAKASDNAKLDLAESRLEADQARLLLSEGKTQEAALLLTAAESKLAGQAGANPEDVELQAEGFWVQGLRAAASQDRQTLQRAVAALESLDKRGVLAATNRARWLAELRRMGVPSSRG